MLCDIVNVPDKIGTFLPALGEKQNKPYHMAHSAYWQTVEKPDLVAWCLKVYVLMVISLRGALA